MNPELGYPAAFLVGLLGGVHCVGMCGGIVGALTVGLPEMRRTGVSGLRFQLAYNAGRIASYTLAGALVGGLGMLLATWLPVALAQRLLLGLAGVFMMLLGLYLGGWWMALSRVEVAGGHLWRHIEPLGRRFLPVRSPARALALGLVWGWLPCGLVYSVLIWSLSAGGVLQGAGLMLAFGLGTLPNLMLMGLMAGWLLRHARRPAVRKTAGALVFLFGVYTLVQAADLLPSQSV
jgi:sulfite exporter TauE/SafE